MSDLAHDHARYVHQHIFLGRAHHRQEARARMAAWLTFGFMLVEVAAGLWTGSMALLADGIHMATHAAALFIAALGYFLARRHAADPRFSFGSGKFGDLAAFSNALFLGATALWLTVESVIRLIEPRQVAYREALIVAGLGLAINLLTALLLRDDHHHHHHGEAHDGEHEHEHEHEHDHNLRAAYLHVLADALTSILAMLALSAGLVLGWGWADAVAGLLGAVMIGRWAAGLMRDSALVLLDAEDDPALAQTIKAQIDQDFGLNLCDFHLWRLGPGHRGLIVSLVGASPNDPAQIRAALIARHPSLSHVTVEIAYCAACKRQACEV